MVQDENYSENMHLMAKLNSTWIWKFFFFFSPPITPTCHLSSLHWIILCPPRHCPFLVYVILCHSLCGLKDESCVPGWASALLWIICWLSCQSSMRANTVLWESVISKHTFTHAQETSVQSFFFPGVVFWITGHWDTSPFFPLSLHLL